MKSWEGMCNRGVQHVQAAGAHIAVGLLQLLFIIFIYFYV